MENVKIHKAGSLPNIKAPEISFTGEVLISNYFECENPSKLIGATVFFKPGSRTSWKINPLGQTLIIIGGIGLAQCEDEEIFEIKASDIVQFPEGKRHWDGATPNQTLTYIAIHESKDGNAVRFLEKVTDEEYSKGHTLLNQNPNK
ncbi:cupin domain-containing protein [Pedobacter sp. MC2016-05]|uniref:cupin domain-containing protein n=1 Tax=Pedobacter sp. MC2016-05 TaxID=2994474 RepID=UPI0022474CD4|nr:cupin domain-containing protein [Pedobacter sp. MC2016-05]MCX2476299.1 cupin domain-containing protein [Pedobacter sp. MC2016-05]